jgi:hypothetical protein
MKSFPQSARLENLIGDKTKREQIAQKKVDDEIIRINELLEQGVTMIRTELSAYSLSAAYKGSKWKFEVYTGGCVGFTPLRGRNNRYSFWRTRDWRNMEPTIKGTAI